MCIKHIVSSPYEIKINGKEKIHVPKLYTDNESGAFFSGSVYFKMIINHYYFHGYVTVNQDDVRNANERKLIVCCAYQCQNADIFSSSNFDMLVTTVNSFKMIA